MWCKAANKLTCDETPYAGDDAALFEVALITGYAQEYSFKSVRNGKYCRDEGDRIKCNRDSVGEKERFTIHNTSDGYVSLKGGNNGKYCADEGGEDIMCNRDGVGEWEQYKLECAPSPADLQAKCESGAMVITTPERDPFKFCITTGGGRCQASGFIESSQPNERETCYAFNLLSLNL